MALNNKTFRQVLKIGVNAGADLEQARFVNFAGNYCSAGTKSLGVTELGAVSGEKISVISIGTAIIETSGAISLGANVTADTNGKAKAASGSDAINGRALQACTGADFIEVLLVN